MTHFKEDDPEVKQLLRKIHDVLSQFSTINDFETWLKSHSCVVSTKLADYLIKTEPPQKEIILTCKQANGMTIEKVIDILVHSNDTLELSGIHDR